MEEDTNPVLGMTMPPLGQIDALRLACQLTRLGMEKEQANEIARFLHEASNPDYGEDIRLADLISMQRALTEAMTSLQDHQEDQWETIRSDLLSFHTGYSQMQRRILRKMECLQWAVIGLTVIILVPLAQSLISSPEAAEWMVQLAMWREAAW